MRRNRSVLLAAAMTALLAPTILAPTAAGAAPPQQEVEVELLASGLAGPSGGAIGPDGALYVVEGAVGQITRIDPGSGEATTYASGLPPAVIGIGGAIDIVFRGNTAYVLVAIVGSNVGGDQIDGIYRVDDADSFTVIADLGAWSAAHPPTTRFDLSEGVQFALETSRSGFLVTDGHHNRVLNVSRSGAVSELIQFENTVPTGLDVLGNTVYLAMAGAVPHAPEDGTVEVFGLNDLSPSTVASGYSLITDVELGRCNALYALSQGDSPGDVPAGSPALPESGELLVVNRDGTFSVVADGLNLPTSLHIAGDTAFVVSLSGDVLKISGLSGNCGQKVSRH
ncbi:ScyD/ScyE family protein [Marisediminicola antarctica]|nr:ScyD/ScyE family protein [Marisediminicola antarctica]